MTIDDRIRLRPVGTPSGDKDLAHMLSGRRVATSDQQATKGRVRTCMQDDAHGRAHGLFRYGTRTGLLLQQSMDRTSLFVRVSTYTRRVDLFAEPRFQDRIHSN